uniref:ATP synthase CF1 delta subunit n=1 Tax=Asparagopsis taxiformis TaxID=260499 RepID=A0A1C9CC54_9FLOR|nr:ATP synthase CF1 delta subunit [Asparagopsis taxiformis]AOM65924.1 ATP synthase CF1 delta subunit [Asparagopsis taxiformis]
MSSQSPMAKVVLPYAEALLESVQELNLVEQTNSDVSVICNTLSESKDLKSFLENPLISALAKKNVITKIFSNQVNDNVLKFLLVIIDRRRIALLDLIIEKYLELSYKQDSITVAHILTPISLTEVQSDQLIEKLKLITDSNKIQLAIDIDSTIIGGLKIQIGSKVIDCSLSGKLNQMASYLNAI